MFDPDNYTENGITFDDDLETEKEERASEVEIGEGQTLPKYDGKSETEEFDVEAALEQL